MHKSQKPDHPSVKIFIVAPNICGPLSVDPAAYHSSDAWDYQVTLRFLEKSVDSWSISVLFRIQSFSCSSVYGNTDTRRLTTGIRSEKCVVRRFRCCANAYLHKPS